MGLWACEYGLSPLVQVLRGGFPGLGGGPVPWKTLRLVFTAEEYDQE